MGVLADLIPQSQPAYYGSGHGTRGVVGATWRWLFADVIDGAGDPIDLSGVTGTCEILDSDGSPIATPTFDGTALGTFSLELDETLTAALTPGTYRWRLLIDDGTDTWCVWHGGTTQAVVSKIVIEAA